MCIVLTTMIYTAVGGTAFYGGYRLFKALPLDKAWTRFKTWANTPTNSFGPGATVSRCACHKINFGGGPG